MIVGIDVFHAPAVYDPKTKKKGRKASCAAIVVEFFMPQGPQSTQVTMYSKTFKKEGGEEYNLGGQLCEVVSTAIRLLNVAPRSAIIWRDGIGESAAVHALREIDGVRQGLMGAVPVGVASQTPHVPLTYIVCQKRIDTKFLTRDGKSGAEAGTLVTEIGGSQYPTFYINGRAPPFSTPKPVRYIVMQHDQELRQVDLGELTWICSHDYPNWTGSIKVPSVCQMAHKSAELAGGMVDGGESIHAEKFLNKIYFL